MKKSDLYGPKPPTLILCIEAILARQDEDWILSRLREVLEGGRTDFNRLPGSQPWFSVYAYYREMFKMMDLSLLEIAIIYNCPKVCNFIIEHKLINPNRKSLLSFMPIHWAILNTHNGSPESAIKIIDLLLDNTIDANGLLSMFSSPLVLACLFAPLPVIKKLTHHFDLERQEFSRANLETPRRQLELAKGKLAYHLEKSHTVADVCLEFMLTRNRAQISRETDPSTAVQGLCNYIIVHKAHVYSTMLRLKENLDALARNMCDYNETLPESTPTQDKQIPFSGLVARLCFSRFPAFPEEENVDLLNWLMNDFLNLLNKAGSNYCYANCITFIHYHTISHAVVLPEKIILHVIRALQSKFSGIEVYEKFKQTGLCELLFAPQTKPTRTAANVLLQKNVARLQERMQMKFNLLPIGIERMRITNFKDQDQGREVDVLQQDLAIRFNNVESLDAFRLKIQTTAPTIASELELEMTINCLIIPQVHIGPFLTIFFEDERNEWLSYHEILQRSKEDFNKIPGELKEELLCRYYLNKLKLPAPQGKLGIWSDNNAFYDVGAVILKHLPSPSLRALTQTAKIAILFGKHCDATASDIATRGSKVAKTNCLP